MAAPAHITSPNEPFPSPEHLEQATTTHRQGGFVITTRKLPISKAGPIARLEADLGIPVPEMIFGDNLVAVAHAASGFRVAFTARDALDAVGKDERGMLQVAYARAWAAARRGTAGIRDVVRPFDWSYSTRYRGTVTAPSTDRNFKPSDDAIPLELLKRRDPILFFDEVMLYESELDDNGISVLSAKVRVHAARLLLLARLYMRLDGVLVRVRDTRVYVDIEAEKVVREYTAREAGFDEVKQKLLMNGLRPDAITVALRDANQVADLLPIVEKTNESVSLKDE
ncbi:TIP41-domain-containing protein [Xylariomycetidae sp. FL0641]|nr:TIP41-domain-containing protein [Xylariomycetidae sp. FL0641]